MLAFILCLAIGGYLAVGFSGSLFCVTFIGGFILWFFTTCKTPVNTQQFLLSYLLTAIFFIIHVYEEYVSHIEITLEKISGFRVSQNQFLIIAAFVAPAVWLIGAVMALKRWAFGYFLISTFLFGMMLGEVSHFFFPFIEDGTFHYSAGMYTAILPIVSGWITFLKIQQEIKKIKSNSPADKILN